MKLLVLTDHSRHHSSNSFYAITNALLARPEITKVSVASRAIARNASFFTGEDTGLLWGITLAGRIDYAGFPNLIKQSVAIDPSEADIILLRLPRPVAEDFFPSILKAFPATIIINDPAGIMLTSDKSFLSTLDQYVPPCRVCHSWSDVEQFASNFPVVLKPLKEYGGKGLVRIDGNKGWIGQNETEIETIRQYFTALQEPMLAMKFLKNVGLGDKRIVVADGHILSTSIRYPATGSWLCNVSQGGYAEHVNIENRDRELVEYINPIMLRHGILLYGIDTLVDDDGLRVISEINTLSVGGIAPAEEETGRPVTAEFAEVFVQYSMRKRNQQ